MAWFLAGYLPRSSLTAAITKLVENIFNAEIKLLGVYCACSSIQFVLKNSNIDHEHRSNALTKHCSSERNSSVERAIEEAITDVESEGNFCAVQKSIRKLVLKDQLPNP